MKVKFGMIVTDGRNKLGADVFSRNHYGNFSRAYVIPANPNTTYQQQIRAIFKTASQLYTLLTQSQQDAWIAAAQTYQRSDNIADKFYGTGQNLFVRLNFYRIAFSLGAYSVPPAKSYPSRVPHYTISGHSTGSIFQLTFTTALPNTGEFFAIQSTPGLSAGINYVSTAYRLVSVQVMTGQTTINLSTAYIARFASPANGKKIFSKITVYSPSMYASEPFCSKVIVTP